MSFPEEFIEFSKKFKIGFLSWIEENRPKIELVEFKVEKEHVEIETAKEVKISGDGSKAALILENPFYTEKCEFALIQGTLSGAEKSSRFLLFPEKIIWSLAFNLNNFPKFPEMVIKRWKKKQ